MLGSWTIVDAGNTLSQQSIPTGFPARPQATCRSAAHLPVEWGGPPHVAPQGAGQPSGNLLETQHRARIQPLTAYGEVPFSPFVVQ